MSEAEVIDSAVQAIGKDRPGGDYVLAPTTHAEELADKAPALARLLRTSKLRGLARKYEYLDRDARAAQKRFSRATLWANAAVFATGVLSAVIMGAVILKPLLGEAVMGPALITLGLGTLLSGAFATGGLLYVRQGNLLEEWVSERADAEASRLAYFETLARSEEGSPSEPPLGLLKLEYFRRYQLDMQLAYAGQRRRRHRAAAKLTLVFGAFAAGLTAMASGLAGIVASSNAIWASLAAVGVIGTALAGFAERQEAIFQDRSNANRLKRTLSALEDLSSRLDDVRHGVAVGSQAVLEEYVAAVHEQISAARREWLSSAESSRAAISKMDETLGALQRQEAGRP